MGVYIKAISYYLPDNIVTNDQLVTEFEDASICKIATQVGVEERHVSISETATDLAVKVAEKLFSDYAIDRTEIDFVVLCTQSPDYFLPSSSCIIQNRLGLPTTCGAFDYNLGCSGYVYGLAVAKGLIKAGVANNILLLTADTITRYIHQKDKGNKLLFGDGATATVVSSSGFMEIGEFSLGTDGGGFQNLIVKTGAMRHKHLMDDAHIDEQTGTFVSSDNLYMNGNAIFDFTSEVVPELIQNVLTKNNIEETDVNLYVFHQANKYMLNYLRKLMGISKDRFYINLSKTGNVTSSSIPIALKLAQTEGSLFGNVIIAGFGIGLSWGGVCLKCENH